MILSKKDRSTVAFSICIVAGIGLAFASYLAYKHSTLKRGLVSSAQQYAQNETAQVAKELNSFINRLVPLAQQLADELSKNKLSKTEIEQRLQQKPNEIFGLGVAFAPHAYSGREKLYAPYYVEQKGENKLTHLEYDYTQPEHAWYNTAVQRGAHFAKRYYSKTSKATLAEYVTPIHRTNTTTGEKEVIGVVFANQSVAHLQHVLSTLYMDQTGYWMILDQDGALLAHPEPARISNQETIFDIAQTIGDAHLAEKITTALAGNSISTEYKNEITGAPSWLFCSPITVPGWTLCHVFDIGEFGSNQHMIKAQHPKLQTMQLDDFLRKQLMNITFAFVCALLLSIIGYLLYYPISLSSCWYASACTAFILIAHIGTLWMITKRHPDYKEELNPVRSQKELATFIDERNQSANEQDNDTDDTVTPYVQAIAQLQHRYAHKKHVLTGLFINHLKFISERNIEIVGYVWQRYIDGIHDKLSRGFEMPQATSMDMEELYRKTARGVETILWRVHATLNQRMAYAQYPFDVKDLQIQLWHKDFARDIVLIPDLDSYRLINPRSLPGLNREINTIGWSMEGSYFGYKKQTYATIFGMYKEGTFGIYKQMEKSKAPELYFNIKAQRQLINTIFADLLPLSVISLLLFLILMTASTQMFTALAACATVFFGTVVPQVRFRDKVPAFQLVYFEHFYLVMYGAIITVLIISLLYHLKFNISIIRYKDNLIAKLLYWPTLLGVLNILTIWYLY